MEVYSVTMEVYTPNSAHTKKHRPIWSPDGTVLVVVAVSTRDLLLKTSSGGPHPVGSLLWCDVASKSAHTTLQPPGVGLSSQLESCLEEESHSGRRYHSCRRNSSLQAAESLVYIPQCTPENRSQIIALHHGLHPGGMLLYRVLKASHSTAIILL